VHVPDSDKTIHETVIPCKCAELADIPTETFPPHDGLPFTFGSSISNGMSVNRRSEGGGVRC